MRQLPLWSAHDPSHLNSSGTLPMSVAQRPRASTGIVPKLFRSLVSKKTVMGDFTANRVVIILGWIATAVMGIAAVRMLIPG